MLRIFQTSFIYTHGVFGASLILINCEVYSLLSTDFLNRHLEFNIPLLLIINRQITTDLNAHINQKCELADIINFEFL
ncbi:hypothetical protein L585_00685 [Pantoea ananatis BRT175]|nr:hypothetical protein L585_00685 [Pantoea ananatis BRT175]